MKGEKTETETWLRWSQSVCVYFPSLRASHSRRESFLPSGGLRFNRPVWTRAANVAWKSLKKKRKKKGADTNHKLPFSLLIYPEHPDTTEALNVGHPNEPRPGKSGPSFHLKKWVSSTSESRCQLNTQPANNLMPRVLLQVEVSLVGQSLWGGKQKVFVLQAGFEKQKKRLFLWCYLTYLVHVGHSEHPEAL